MPISEYSSLHFNYLQRFDVCGNNLIKLLRFSGDKLLQAWLQFAGMSAEYDAIIEGIIENFVHCKFGAFKKLLLASHGIRVYERTKHFVVHQILINVFNVRVHLIYKTKQRCYNMYISCRFK